MQPDVELDPEVDYEYESDSEEEKVEEIVEIDIANEPEQGAEGICTLSFRLPDSSTLNRRFLKTDTMEYIYLFLKSQGYSNVKICTSFPVEVLEKGEKTLEECKFHPRSRLLVNDDHEDSE